MKKFRLLSSLLALVMVLSMITVMPAGAATAGTNAFFCDFESFENSANTNGKFSPYGLYMYNTDIVGQWGVAVTTKSDSNMAVTLNSQIGHLYVGAPSVVTKGKVYIGFETKGASYQYLKAFFEAPRKADGDVKKYPGEYLARIREDVYMINSSDNSTELEGTKMGERDLEKWSYVQAVVDLDNDSWTVYLDGDKLGTYEFGKDYTEFHGFSFYTSSASGSGLIDNISIVTESELDAQTTVNGEGRTEISAVAPVNGLDNLTKDDIKVTKCGSTETVDVASVANVANNLTITIDGTLDAGCEYAVTFDAYKDVVLYAYTAPSANAKTGYYKLDFEGEYSTASFSEYNSSGNLITREVVDNEDINKIIETTVKGNNTLNRVKVMDLSGSANETNASGKVLASLASGTHFYMLDVIGTDVGVETYEFDYKWYWSSQSNKGFLMMSGDDTVNGATEKTILTMNKEDVWHHVKIDYDTEADTLTVTKDGTPTVFTKVPKFDNKLYLYAPTQTVNPVFQIDNYEQYVTGVAPLAVEKVRYTDADDNVTGGNLISPATKKIEITFSEDVDDTVANAITLTANKAPVETTAIPNGNVITLTFDSLPGSSDIELTIPAADRVYNVKTAKVEVVIGSLIVEDVAASGSVEANDKITVTASEINATGSANITLIYAFYNDDELIAADVANKKVTVDTTEEFHTFTITKAFDYDEVKAFVWDGLTTMVPLITSVTAE